MRHFLCLIFLFCVTCSGIFAETEITSDDLNQAVEPFSSLKSGHPRLLIGAHTAADCLVDMDKNPEKKQNYDMLVKKARSMLSSPAVQYKKGDILEISRTALKRIQTLAFLYRADGDKRWLDRAKIEILSAASFPDWNPNHFLDTAEMMTALSLGYDWLYDELSPDERQTIRQALVLKGLAAAKDAYDHKSYFWVTDDKTNWNIVCNGSILSTALALGKDEADSKDTTLAAEMARVGLSHLRDGMTNYGPDGGWDEGPMYWRYATMYAARAIVSLQTACAHDFGLSAQPGLSRAGDYILAMVGPTGKAFNYADSTADFDACPQLLWLAKQFYNPLWSWKERDQLRKNRSDVSALDLIWWSDDGTAGDLATLPCGSYFAGRTQAVSMRTSWTDPLASYVGFVGGSNMSHHCHLGLGNFVYESQGQRWVTLLGPDDYDLPGYFDITKGDLSPRWKYYRNASVGQNVFTLSGANQKSHAQAKMESFHFDEKTPASFAICNLSEAYDGMGVSSVKRGIALFKPEKKMLVQDQFVVKPEKSVDLVWQIHTSAKVLIVGKRQALLSQGGKVESVELLNPIDGCFETEAVNIEPPQLPAPGISKLLVRLHVGNRNDSRVRAESSTRDITVAVLFSDAKSENDKLKADKSESAKSEAQIKIVPMKDWQTVIIKPLEHKNQ